MKTAFFLLACTCLINGLTASFLEDEETNFDNEISPQLDIFFPENGDVENLIVPFPTNGPPRPFPTTGRPFPTTGRPFPTTGRPFPTTGRPFPTTGRPFPTTGRPFPTTGRPFPTSTTRRPFPTTTGRPFPPPRPNPALERIQIYNNAVRSMGPLAGRLVNVVLNRGRSQKTLQKNDILYNLNFMRGNRRSFAEETEN